MASVMVFTGNANPELTNQIARSLGISISNALVDLYSDGEINIEIKMGGLCSSPPKKQSRGFSPPQYGTPRGQDRAEGRNARKCATAQSIGPIPL